MAAIKNDSDTLSKEKANGRKQNTNQRRESRQAKQGRTGGLEETEGSRLLDRGQRNILKRIGMQLGITIRISNQGIQGKSDAEWNPRTRTITISLEAASKGDIQ